MFHAAGRLINFDVAMTNLSPWLMTPSPSNWSLCAYYPGTFTGTLTLQCDVCMTPSRYLIVRLRGSNTLTLCEVQVYLV